MPPPEPFRIVIAGAGVAGSILAQGLMHQPGLDVICLEQVGPDDHAEAGTGLNIGPNAIKALWQLDPELAEGLLAKAWPWRRWRVELTDGTALMDLALDRVADNPGIRIRWSELYRFLRTRARDAIHHHRRILSARPAWGREPGPLIVEAEDADGILRTIDGIDLLVGADGRYSRIRESFLGKPEVRQLGVALSRVLIPDRSGGLIGDYGQWFNGPCRLLAFTVPEDGLYIAGAVPVDPNAPVPDTLKHPDTLRRCYVPPRGWPSPQAGHLIDALCAHADRLHWARIQEADVAFGDRSGHVLLLGDAAHPMAPTLGQGATQAIEDACVAVAEIRRALRQNRHTGARLQAPRLVAAIGWRRLDRVRFVQRFSRDAGDTMLAGSDPVAGTRAKMEPAFLEKLAMLYRDI